MSSESGESESWQAFFVDPLLRSRAGRFLRRLTHTGMALYLISSVVLAATALCWREAVAQIWRNRAAMSSEIESFIRGHPDMGIRPNQWGAVAFALGAASRDQGQEGMSEARRKAQQIERAFAAAVVDMAPDAPDAPDGGSLVHQVIRQELHDAHQTATLSRWEAQLSNDISAFSENYQSAKPLSPTLYRCDADALPSDDPHIPPISIPVCEREGGRLTRLYAPALCGEFAKNATHTCKDPSCCHRKVESAAALSRPLEVLLEAFMGGTCPGNAWNESLVSVHFTSPNGFFREWVCDPAYVPNNNGFFKAPLTASYFRRLHQERSTREYETDVYLDSIGFGPVRTRCLRVTTSASTPSGVEGILCFDFTVPISQLLGPLATSSIVQVDVAKVVLPDAEGEVDVSHYWTLKVPWRARAKGFVREWLTPAGDSVRSEFEMALHQALSDLEPGMEDLREVRNRLTQEVVPLPRAAGGSQADDGRFVLPAGWDDGGRSRMLVILRPANASLQGAKLLLVVGVVGIILWVLLLWRGNRLSKRLAENQLVAQLLQKLGLGLVLLDENGGVMAANDAAENTLQMYLPRLNTWRLRIDKGFRQERQPSDPDVRVATLIEEDVVNDSPRVRVKYRDVWERRLRGRPAVFFAKLRKQAPRPGWLKITAAPVVLKQRRRKTLTTSLSVLEVVEDVQLLRDLNHIHSEKK